MGKASTITGTEGWLREAHREFLRGVALDSIRHGMVHGAPLEVDGEGCDPLLLEPRAVFVTLLRSGSLRGCIGSLEACRPLVQDVAVNAYSAAFRDFRFPPLSDLELIEIEMHISLLSPPESLSAKDRGDLLAMLRPGVDGLVLEDPPHRSTFLPQVWEKLPDPERFLEELLLKAGLPRDHWSRSISFYRYRVEEF